MGTDPAEAAKLKDEWARAQGFGRALARRRMVATLASLVVTTALVFGGYAALWLLWPFDKIPVVYLGLPWIPALPVGWLVRQKLWPRGQFAGG
jgi:hypothetical protein